MFSKAELDYIRSDPQVPARKNKMVCLLPLVANLGVHIAGKFLTDPSLGCFLSFLGARILQSSTASSRCPWIIGAPTVVIYLIPMFRPASQAVGMSS